MNVNAITPAEKRKLVADGITHLVVHRTSGEVRSKHQDRGDALKRAGRGIGLGVFDVDTVEAVEIPDGPVPPFTTNYARGELHIPITAIFAYELATGLSLGESDPWPVGALSEVERVAALGRAMPGASVRDVCCAYLRLRIEAMQKVG